MDRRNEHLPKSGMPTHDVADTNTTNIPKCKPVNCRQDTENWLRWSEQFVKETTLNNWNKGSKRKYIATKIHSDRDRYHNEENHITEKFQIVPLRKKIKQTEEVKKPLKLVLTRKKGTDQFKSQFKSLNITKDNALTIATEMESMNIMSGRPTDSVGYSNSIIGTVRLRDIQTIMIEHNYKYYKEFVSENKIKSPEIIKNYITVTESPKNGKYLPAVHANIPMFDIERIYNNYFQKTIQDSIAIIANILNMIIIINNHYKLQMGECNKNPDLAEKEKSRQTTSYIHLKNTKILEAKLKKHFINIISSIVDTEFELIIQMVIVCILKVFRVLDHPVIRITDILKMLVYIMSKSLKNSELEYPKLYSIIDSDSFCSHCYNLLKRVKDSQENYPDIINRMALFFISTINGQEYFETVTAAITSNSNEDIEVLINNAEVHYHVNSKFEDPIPVNPPTINNYINLPEITVLREAEHIHEDTQGTVTQVTNGTYQSNSTNNEQNMQINIPLKPTPSNIALNTNYETISSAPYINVASTSLGQPTTLNSFNPTTYSQYNNILTEDPMNQSNEMQNTYNYNNIVVETMPSTLNEHVLKHTHRVDFLNLHCLVPYCPNSAIIICGFCFSAQYCSYDCQNWDWILSHQYYCTQLQLYNNTNDI